MMCVVYNLYLSPNKVAVDRTLDSNTSFDESTESVTLLDSDSDLSLSCLDADPSDDDEDDAVNEKKTNLCKISSTHWRTPLVKLRNLFHFIQAFSKRKIK